MRIKLYSFDYIKWESRHGASTFKIIIPYSSFAFAPLDFKSLSFGKNFRKLSTP